MKVVIEIDADAEVFQGFDGPTEVAKILRKVANLCEGEANMCNIAGPIIHNKKQAGTLVVHGVKPFSWGKR